MQKQILESVFKDATKTATVLASSLFVWGTYRVCVGAEHNILSWYRFSFLWQKPRGGPLNFGFICTLPKNALHCILCTCLSRTISSKVFMNVRDFKCLDRQWLQIVLTSELLRSAFQSSNPIGQFITRLYAHMHRCPHNTLN